MRLRRKPWIETAIHEFDSFVYPKDRPAGEAERGHWHEIFGRRAPLYVELGTGKGDFISQIAVREPQHDFIGIEAEQDVLYRAAAKVAALSLPNVRLLVFDIKDMATLFLPGEIDGLYLNFCDPWPKKRHFKRRLTYREFLETYRLLLKPGGKLWFKTDNRPLFEFSLEEFAAAGLTVADVSYDLHAEARPDNIETEYERKFSGFGEKIHRCEVTFP
ncbi:MAG: tRNA (guanosine(46)-N7)-methyltransferase TrmB [Schwartzia sp.]|nr:tRNA (guanosine(46)-N7)-methyltransferase TrmB [Schwartzia sp. (in: firmicutes)]